MHILQVSPHYLPAAHFGGVQHVVHSLSKAFQKQGHDVRVCTTNLETLDEPLDVPTGVPLLVDGVTVFYEPVRFLQYWGFSPSLARQIWKQCQWADVAMLHFHYQFASLVGGWICRLWHRPYLIFSHGSLNTYGIVGRRRIPKEIYLNLLERGNFKHALYTAYHSAEEMEHSYQFGRGQVVPNGINPDDFIDLPPKGLFRNRFPKLQNRRVFLYLGRLDVGKGLDILLPAFRRLLEAHIDVHLVLAGGDEKGYERFVRQMIVELQLQDFVTLTGLIRGDLKLAALQDADVFVLPSRSEGLSIAMLEAMYMGLPVITTDRVGLWRTIRNEQLGWVVPLDEQRLANALLEAAHSSVLSRIGEQARNFVQRHHTWDVIAANLLAELRDEGVFEG